MLFGRRRSVLLLGIATALLLTGANPGRELIGDTDAAWTDPEHTSATVTSGTWPTSGYGHGVSSYVKAAGGLTILGGTALPWTGMQGNRSQATPGTATQTTTGPTSSANVIGVNRLTLAGSSGSGASTGTGCGSYLVGSADTPCVPGATASASASITGQSVRMSAVAVLGIDLISTDIVLVNTAARALSASVGCNIAAGSSTAVAPNAPVGYVLVGNRQIAIPPVNTSSAKVSYSDGLTISYSDVQLHSAVASGATTPSAYSRLRLTGRATATTILGLQLLSIAFDIYLLSAECGPGAAPAFPPAGDPAITSAAARMAPQAASATTGRPATSSTTAESTTAESTTAESTTAAPTTESVGATTTTPALAPAEATPTTTGTSTPPTATTGPPPVAEPPVAEPPAVEPPAVEPPVAEPPTAEPPTAEPPAAEPPSPEPPSTTALPAPVATVFTGTADGNVESLTFEGGVVCRAAAEADYEGTVELSCSDDTSMTVRGSALTPTAVASATADGVWAPVLLDGAAPRPVLSAVRG